MSAAPKPDLPSQPCVDRLRVLADPTRLQVIHELDTGSLRAGELNDRIPIAQNLLSHHLRVLRDAGLVVSTRDGKSVVYSLARDVRRVRGSLAIDLGCCRVNFRDS